MARIRTIKPEFPQSESMGRVSRDARLLFVELWTICDDSGRTRAASRMLASLLFPYDDDAPSLICDWLAELEREHCIVRYMHDGASYIEVCNWLSHQKIDKPSPSKIPAFGESSRIIANPRERSSEDQGPRTKDQGEEGKGEEQTPAASAADQCPHSEIIAAYHELLPELTRVKSWDADRRELLRTRWREDKERQSVQWWREYFTYVRKCPFLIGQENSPGREPFLADLEWLVRPKNFRKVIEGKYESRRAA